MTRLRLTILMVVIAHWFVAIVHLFFAANVLPAPNNHVTWQAITFITLGHVVVSAAIWMLKDKPAGFFSLLFFLAAMGADLYEHFLHASGNNVFMVPSAAWTIPFDVSVIILLALEILGCFLGMRLLRGRETAGTPMPSTKNEERVTKNQLRTGNRELRTRLITCQ